MRTGQDRDDSSVEDEGTGFRSGGFIPEHTGRTPNRQDRGRVDPVPGRAYGSLLTDRVGYLPQRLDGLDDAASALENVRAVAPGTPPGEVRNQLARLLLRGDGVDRPVATLSGGERFRVCLATLLLAEPPAQLLVLDEPTNNLDTSSVEQLAEALDAYRGALLVVSHDYGFLRRLGIDTVLEIDREGGLRQRAELGD